ncbi:hypothetical protein UWK_02294 [Desulfocapsa sulfexigens DSM 10523]|uniref:Uncharacterized protein n=1 Tax=Desulfocapsa sulfexigens (strain DSM 10523 / SB164P1) TaxID=1167006 RepID=M1NGS8_DESSD|nr:hypothetical protein [Desulfocapsa sulfexigens]AGF78834.1 hypothetical protein UWK_02294 [Desulfocapsa sulfexigens DSM 10523]
MIQRLLLVISLVLSSSGAIAADLPDSSDLPRMPDAYRNNDYKDLSKRNPYGMSVYDIAERKAEEDIFGSEVISLEESRRILEERKAKNKEQAGVVQEKE